MSSMSFTRLDPSGLLIAPSILAADFSRLGTAIEAIDHGGADIIHVDIMDGHFVPNLTIGPAVVKSIRSCSTRPFDCHLMIEEPENFIDAFAQAGADNLTVHVELGDKTHELIRIIHDQGCSAGVCLKPGTSAISLAPFLEQIDLVLVMTVEPGFGGQSFMHDMLPKISRVREMIEMSNRAIHLEVDGGIGKDTAPLAATAGANILVAGTSVFGAGNARVADRIRTLRSLC